jgi:hypothetical protein
VNLYRQFAPLAQKHLAEAGFIEELLTKHAETLLEYRLLCDLGMSEKSFRKPKRSEDPMTPVAEVFLAHCCAWPIEASYLGVSLIGRFDPVFISILNERKAWTQIYPQIPEEHQTDALFVHGLKRGWISEFNITAAQLTNAVLDQVVDSVPDIIQHRTHGDPIPYDIALRACRRSGKCLQYVPLALHTDELVDVAINSSALAIEHVKSEFFTQERCAKFVSRYGYLDRVPTVLITRQMACAALVQNHRNIRDIPADHIDAELFLEAIASNPLVMSSVPDDLRTPEFYVRAVERHLGVFHYMPNAAITEDLVCHAADRNVMVISKLSAHHLTERVLDLVLSKRPEVASMIPKSVLTQALILKAVKGWPFAVLMLDGEQLTPEVIMLAVQQDYKVMALLPKELVTEDVEMEALRQNGELLRHVDYDLRRKDRCLAALSNSDLALPHVPQNLLRSRTFKREALALNPALIESFKRLAQAKHEDTLDV